MGISAAQGIGSVKAGVCTSTTRPSNPYEGQMIYETDTDLLRIWDGASWVETVSMLTKAPRGVMAYASSTTATTATSTQTVATGMTATFTAVANRYYKITYFEPEFDFAATQGQYIHQRIRLTNVSGTIYNTLAILNPSAFALSLYGQVVAVTTLSAGSTTIVGTLFANTGTVSVYRAAGFVATLVVEDIGAV
jgi:hypothetical protein